MTRHHPRWPCANAALLGRLTEQLCELLRPAPKHVCARYGLPGCDSGRAAAARRLYAERRMRSEAFGENARLFVEPVWGLLLDLYVARAERRSLSLTAACIGSGVPTKALRCIAALPRKDFVAGRRSDEDGRMKLVGVTDIAASLLERHRESLA